MKKIGLALVLAAAIALTFAGCSNSSDSGAAAAGLAAVAGTGTGTGNGTGTNNETGANTETNNGKTQNDAQSAGDENASIAETSVFKAEAVEGGIKFTIKPFARPVEVPLIRVCGTGDDKSHNYLHPDWPDGSVAWTCLYPYVTAGKSYKIVLQADSGLAPQTLTLKASSGIGVIPKEGSVSIAVEADKITATINDYAVGEKIPGGTSELTDKRTMLLFFAGEGNAPEGWDGAYINSPFYMDIFTTTMEIPNTDYVYRNLKTNMTGEYNGKKLYIQSFYRFKKPGIPADIRICCWETHVAPADMHWSGAYMTLGSWPQTIKADGVTVDESVTRAAGEFTYYKGSDNEWYAKLSDKYYKVEPIEWRVLTTDFNGTGKKLLHAAKVLIKKDYDASNNNYQNSGIRKWLNSNANSDAASDYSASGGFLKTAFNAEELAKIVGTSVDNSARSTNPDNNATQWNSGNNQYASDTSTTDKVFLLSTQEATKSAYGFDENYTANSNGNARIRFPTDYAKASGAGQSASPINGGSWWLRSPSFGGDNSAQYVIDSLVNYVGCCVTGNSCGVVPALCVGE